MHVLSPEAAALLSQPRPICSISLCSWTAGSLAAAVFAWVLALVTAAGVAANSAARMAVTGLQLHALPCLQDGPSSHQAWDSNEGPSATNAGQTMHHARGGACVAEDMGGIIGRSTP